MVLELDHDVSQAVSQPNARSELNRQASMQDFMEVEEKKEVKVSIDGREFRVNPQQMRWSKQFKIDEAEVVYDQDITQWMGKKNKRLTMSIKTFTSDEKEFLWYLGDEDGPNPGPHEIEAAIPTGSLCMYLSKWDGHQLEGESDDMWYWTLEFVEANENGV